MNLRQPITEATPPVLIKNASSSTVRLPIDLYELIIKMPKNIVKKFIKNMLTNYFVFKYTNTDENATWSFDIYISSLFSIVYYE